MTHSKRVVVAAIACLAGAVPAVAQTRLSSNGACQNESAQISVSFSGMDKDVSVVKSKMDAEIAEIKSLAAEEHFTKFDIQSYNYNINANSNGGNGEDRQFQYNGNATFSVLPADRAVEFMALLVKRGYRTSVNVSSYNSGNCPSTLLK